ncbi:MAG: NAD+ synthase [Anaerolineaceae bacterium]|nr:NAD+ synthase [Anaerolineaceae bacterium]
MIDLTINTDVVRKKLTDFIRDELNRAGFTRVVVGLSGGIDSALSCFLAVEALGPENVLAVRMPYKTSSPDSLEDAQRVLEATAVQSKTMPISSMVDAFIDLNPEINDIRRGNIMARMRMIMLFDHSAAFNGLVLGTGNKTEILLGYTTLYGDSACALNPIGDLYKAQVSQLARAVGVPTEIIHKSPSADLWAGQTDEGELGFTYAQVDRLLYLLVDERFNPEQCVEAGFDEAFVKAVITRVSRNHFKRVMPPIARLGNVAAETDFHFSPDRRI